MVAPEVEATGTVSSPGSPTHIYCKPVKVKENCKANKDHNKNGENKTMPSDMKVSSSVVAIDVSGQTFSRMASFQRSLIHVDFLIRRKKKKDKRRNTVTEGDVKELKDALKNIVNDECQFSIPNTISSYQKIIANSKNDYNSKVHENQKNDKHLEEHNNNSANEKFMKKSNCSNSVESQSILDEKSGNCMKGELKLNDSESSLKQYLNKRKSKSHIPISTISAAMNVAVEMRQCNSKAETPISNGVSNNIKDFNYNSDPNSKLHDYNSLSHEDDSSLEDNRTSYKRRLQEKCRTFTSNIKTSNENIRNNTEIDVSSSASSENINPQDNMTSVCTSTESDTFFISSDESDEDSSNVTYFQENYGSSTSLGTASYGSLNSLLSETGTEMTSSTGTLTSIERERLLTPPPPPPPMILSATVKDMDNVAKVSELCIISDFETATGQKGKVENASQKSIKQLKAAKASKSVKADLSDLQKNPTKNSKYIFTSLVNFKMNSKEKNKSKNKETQNKKLNKTSHQPAFDMYGTNSPTKPGKLSTFIKENVSPATQSEEKSNLKSFFADDSLKQPTQFLDEMSNMSKPQRNSQCLNYTKDLHCSKIKEIHAVNNIPQKYEHQVTVTPVQRHTDIEKKNTYHKYTVVTDNEAKQNLMYGNIIRSGSINTHTQIHAAKIQKPYPPVTFNNDNRSKLTARVVLDFDGKVLYSTNSLDRKNCNSDNIVNMYSSVQNKLYEPHFRDTQSINENSYYNFNQECPMLNSTMSGYNSNVTHASDTAIAYSSPTMPFNSNLKQNMSLKNEHYARNESYSSKQIYDPKEILTTQYPKTENNNFFAPKKMTVRPNSFAGDLSRTYLQNPAQSLKPDPNISGLPVQETLLTKHNVNLHSKHMEQMNISSLENNYNHTPSNSVCVTYSSERSSPTNFNKSPQSTMSTEDLFAVIHNCKKRLNIKTDSNLSLASSSSRSSSPSYLRPSSSRGNLAETGFLSPRSHTHLETSRDRRSWADFRPVECFSSERKSLASDRLGPTKPTSMHDFKMLLLQARSSQISGPRKSAVEMLKVPPNQNGSESVKPLHLNLSPRNSISFSVQNSPTTELNLYNGHSTIPFKRGNRARSLQSRYIMYPPIFEDCSEDSENCNDLLGNKSTDINNI